MLRGLEPPASPDEVRDAALQYVRKVGAVSSGPLLDSDAVRAAVDRVAAATNDLLAALPARRNPPPTVPPGRRRSQAAPPGA